MEDTEVFDHGLLTQFADQYSEKQGKFTVVWEKAMESSSHTPTTPNASPGGAPSTLASKVSEGNSSSLTSSPREESNGDAPYSSAAASNVASESETVKPSLKDSSQNSGEISDGSDGSDGEFRAALADYSEADREDIIRMLRPFVGIRPNKSDSEYVDYLKKRGIDVSQQDARAFAELAAQQNRADARKRSAELRESWLRENYPLYAAALDIAGEDFKLKPSARFLGESFTGSWIAKEFIQYSEKRKQGKNESNSSYRKYLARREEALAKAGGTQTDELAAAIANRQGGDAAGSLGA